MPARRHGKCIGVRARSNRPSASWGFEKESTGVFELEGRFGRNRSRWVLTTRLTAREKIPDLTPDTDFKCMGTVPGVFFVMNDFARGEFQCSGLDSVPSSLLFCTRHACFWAWR